MTTQGRLSKADEEQLREALEAERAELIGQVDDLDTDADMARWRDGHFDDDPADAGSAALERDRARSLSGHAQQTLTAVDRALLRLREGSYGGCEHCGEQIPRARLEALPYASLCMDCKHEEERRR